MSSLPQTSAARPDAGPPSIWTPDALGGRAPLARAACAIALSLGVAACEDIFAAPLGSPADASGGDVSLDEIAGIQSFGSVILQPSGADPSLLARLDVLTVINGETKFLSGVANPRVAIGEEEIPLVTGSTAGVYQTSNRISPLLTWARGQEYAFLFEVYDADGQKYAYRTAVTSPADGFFAELAPSPVYYADEPIEFQIFGASDGVVFRVTDAGGDVTYDTAAIASLAEVPAVLGRLRESRGPYEELPGTAFPEPGTYTIEITNLAIVSEPVADDDYEQLGELSWYASGESAAIVLEFL